MILLHWIPLAIVLLMRKTGKCYEIDPYGFVPPGWLVAMHISDGRDALILALPSYQWGENSYSHTYGWQQMYLIWDSKEGFRVAWWEAIQ